MGNLSDAVNANIDDTFPCDYMNAPTVDINCTVCSIFNGANSVDL